MKAVLKFPPPAKSPEEVEIDRILGDQALFDIDDPQKFGGPSPPVLYRARRAGMIETVPSGGRTKISRATMKSLLLEGLGRVDFYYPNSKPKKKTGGSRRSPKGRVDRLQARRETQR